MRTIKTAIGRTLQEVLVLCYNANEPVLLVGGTGIGKTQVVEQTAKELNIACRLFDTTITEPVDLVGLPQINGATVRYVPPEILPRDGAGFVFLDELNRASQQMRNATLQLICSRRLNQYMLPPKWLPVAAVNPSDDENYDTSRLDHAMMARFVKVEVEASVEHWATWAEKAGVHDAVVAYVKATPKVFDAPQSNPRAWTKVSALLHKYECGTYSKDALQVAVCGCVGVELAVAFLRTLRAPASAKVPAPDAIVGGYAKVRHIIQGFKASGNTPCLHSVCQQLFLYLQNPKNDAAIKASPKAIENLTAFRSDLSAEFRKQLDEHAPWIAKGGI